MITYWFLYALPLSIAAIIITAIKEKGKAKRIEKLKGLKDSTIEAIGNYEKKSNFWDKFKS